MTSRGPFPIFEQRLNRLGGMLLVLSAFTGCWRSAPDIHQVGGVVLVYQLEEKAAPEVLENVAMVIEQRLDPSGRRGVVVEPFGEARVRISIPGAAPGADLEREKRLIAAPGILELRILANPHDHGYVIDYALNEEFNHGAEEVKTQDGEIVGRWAALTKDQRGVYRMTPLASVFRNGETDEPFTDETGNVLPKFLPADSQERNALYETFATSQSGMSAEQEYFEEKFGADRIEVLVAVDDGYDVTGAYLEMVSGGVDETGSPCINFTLTEEGAIRFRGLTGENAPDPRTGFKRRLGILLDNYLVTAPELRSMIGRRGQITGNFTQQEVDDLVNILRVGALPARLIERPVKEEIVTPAE